MKKGLTIIIRAITVLVMFTLILPETNYSQNVFTDVPEQINAPHLLADWLSRDFRYVLEYPDRWQLPRETIERKQGDCEDFAVLTSVVLESYGIDNDILIIEFRGMDTGHAVCAWQEKDGTYSFISNRKLHSTGKKHLEAAVGKYYPDWENIIFTDTAGRRLRMVRRKQ